MPINSKIKSLYDALKADGADVGSEQEFSDWFQAPGEQGYNNRKYVYDTFKADGADVGKNYEEFAGWLGLHAVQPQVAQAGAQRQHGEPEAQQGGQHPAQVTPREVVDTQATQGGFGGGQMGGGGANRSWGEVTNATPTPTPVIEPQQPTDVKQKIQPAELTEKEVGDDLAFMREANKSRGDILEAAPQAQRNNGYSTPKMDKAWKLGYSQSWGKIKGLFDGLDYGKKDVTVDLDDAVKSRYDSMSDQAIESELQKLSKEYKAGQWEGGEEALRARISRLQFNLVAHEYGFKDFKDLLSRRGEAEFEMYKYHPAFEQEWLATYKGGPGENPLLNWGKEIVKKQLIEDTMNGVNRPAGYYHSLPFSNEEFSKRYASWALKRAKALGNMGFADVYNNGIKEWETYIGAGLLESGTAEAMAQGAGYRDVGVAGGKYNSDFDAAAATAWNMAEDEYRRLSGAHSNEIWGDYASMGGGREARMVASGEWAVNNMADRLSSHDLDKMIDNAWNTLGESKRKKIMLATAQNLMKQYPGADPAEVVKTAQAMVRQQTIQRVLDYAKAQNAPKNVVDYFARKVLAQNSLIKIQEAMARSRAGTTGDWQAREMAMQEYGKNHRVAGVAGTVVGMGLDPVTYISAGVGKGAAAGTVKLVENIGAAAGRKWLTTTAGKVTIGAISGAANLGTYEGINEALSQLRWGGAPAVDLNTGLIKTTGYDVGKIGKAIFHGSTMGAGTGIVAPLMGNVWSPIMEATSSTAGKMAVKTGELFTGTIAEGTIFSIPDVYDAYAESEDIIKSFSDKKSRNYISDDQERAKAIAKVREKRNETMLDIWNESVATMAGFKAKHIAERLYEVSKSGNGRVGFETRLRYMLDRKPDLALTKDEQAELERGGYADLKGLVDAYVESEKNRRANSKPVVTGRPRTMELGTREEDMPYNRFVDLMNDGSISEAARAKMYYYITGHALPMSTVMYGQLTENKDRDGNVKGYTVQSIGANGVVTSREFTSRKRAENELQKVNRQIELNTIDIGERYNESIGNGTKELREDIGQKYGVDVEKALKKEPKRRSTGEQMALDEYMRRLFPEKEAREEDAEDVTFSDDADVPNETTNGFTDEPTDEGDAIVVETLSRTGEDGMLHPAVLKGDDEATVHIVGGTVATFADGTIDVANSDQDIVIVTANNERKMVNINDIASVGALVDPNAAMDAAEQMNTEPGAAGTPTPQPQPTTPTQESSTGIAVGGRYNVVDEQNIQHEVEVLRDNGNGTLEVRVDGAEDSMPMAKDQLAAMLGIDVASTTPQTERPAATTKPQQEPVELPAPAAENDMQPAAVDVYRIADDADKKAIGMAGFTRDNIQATADYLNGKLGKREYLERLGFDKNVLAGVNDDKVDTWVDGVVNRASAFLTDKPVESDEVRVESDEAPGDKVDRTTATIMAARNGDKEAQDKLSSYGIDWEKKPVVRFVSQGEVDSILAGERFNGRFNDGRVDVTNQTTPTTAANSEYRITYKDELDWALNKRLRMKNKDLGDGWIMDGYSLNDVQTIERRNPDGSYTVVYDANATAPEPMPMREVGKGKNKTTEPDWLAVTPERGHDWLFNEIGLDSADANDIVNTNLEAAKKGVEKASKQKPQKTTNPLVLQSERERIKGEQEAAQAVLDYWNQVKAIEADRQAQTAAERKAKDAEVAAQAQAEEQARQAEEVAKQQEQAERGAGAVYPAIAEKWNNAPKIEGYKDEVVLANGERVPGTYYLVESGAVTPSHNASREFEKYEGFPVDENGNTINDRDYERDKDAQNITRSIADKYDSRALQTPVIVSKDGVVLSGNGRTMAGELAASNNTDGAYIEHLKNYGRKYGFSPEQVSSMQHPRAVFVPDADMPYTTDTFAKFNAQEMKGQSKTEQAVKLGKVVDDATFNQIVRSINDHETLGDFYNNTRAATEAINALRRAGALNEMQYAEMFDGDAVSGTGRQIIENMLIGKAFEGNPDVIRQLTEIKSLRQSVVTALSEITTNKALGKDYSLENELAQAVDLAYKARKAGYKENEQVSPYATQLNLFPFEDGETVADYNNVAVLELADLMNDKRPTLLKKKLQDYNQQSAESAAGQMDIFAGGVKEKKEIIKTVLNTLHNGETEETSRPEQRGPVADERGGETSLQENGAADTGSAALATPQTEPSIDAAIVEAGKETNTEPTDAQKEAGNYKKGHVKIDGFDISIEQPKGSVRSGVDDSGKPWSQTMNNTYGYIRGTEGVDGDHIDVFFSDDLDGWNGTVYVVDQVEKGGIFDEHKVMYGFNSEEEARKAYLSNYEKGWQGLGAITPVSKEEFKKWVDSSHRKTKPFAEYKNVKVEGTQEQEPKQQGTLFPATEQQPSSKSETKPRTTEKQPAEAPKERIDDVGEKIEGAKKDLAKKMGERINLDADTFPKMFPKYDLKKLISQGLDPNLAVMTKMLRQMAQADYKHYSKKRMYGKSYALRAARFYAAYAKQVLEAGDSNVDFKSEGLGFTDYGKQFVELNKRLFEELYNKLGDDLFDLDLAGVKLQPLSQKEGSTWFRRNQETGEMEPYNPAYAFVGPRGQNYYEANELDKALQEGVEQVTKSIDYKKAHPYKLGHYYKPGIKNSDYVGVKLGGKIVPLTEPMTSSEVRKYMSEHNAELQAKAAQLDEQRKLDKKKGGTGEGRWKPELTLGGGRPRVGVDRRGGVDVEPEEFRKAFSFRGVQFGNYVTQRERQRFLNEAYDALMDMAELLGISPRAIAIDGRLGFAIGARGGGKANAHYEPKENVINLTKSKGAGSLAHEWFHALDYYFNRGDKKPTASTANKSTEQFPASTRNEMRKAFLDLMSAIKNSDYFKRSENLEMKLRSGKLDEGYYDKPTELAARAFQDYVVRKLADQGKINDFLSSFTSEEEWNGEPENYPFPIGAEAEKIDEKFDALFDAMQERTDEEGNTILYHLGKDHDVLTDTEIALRDGLVDVMRSVGIDVETDEVKGQKVLDNAIQANATLQEMRGWHGSAAEFDEFDHSHMSEGEGNQAIGYGTYIASIEEIGRYYGTVAAMQKRFRAAPGYGDYDHYWKGQKIDLSSINPLRMAYDIVQREGTIKKAITMVEKFVDNPEAHEGWRSALDILRESRKSDFKRKRANYEGERYLYEVDIPENDGTNYLPWDEPLSDAMRERIAQGLRDMGVVLNEPFERRTGKADNFDFLDEQMSEHPITGQELYYKLVDRFGRYPQQASEFLNKYCGLVGIEYPSNFFSGGNKKGLKNHVIFNEKDIKIDNRTQYFISADGVVYGFVKDGKIYIDPKIATAETPIHEYCHLWGDALKEANPEAWERLKETMLGEKDVLDYVKKMYPGLEGDALVSEVFSHYSGRRGAERLRADMEREMKNAEGVFAKARVARIFDIIKRALSRFWTMARDLFAGKTRGLDRLTAEDFADMAMSDLLRGFNPRKKVSGETFYSNAERAVENIKQNKATAEQWQAMIKKDGGLKAGEDRWMGLSDWLAENKGNSLTKDEVLNFIRENGIEPDYVVDKEVNLNARNYEHELAKMRAHPLLRYLWNHETKIDLPYRDVFKTPTTADYFVQTETTFEPVPLNGKTRGEVWDELKGKYGETYHRSDSGSEYLIDEETGDIYRRSDHWGRVASCRWYLDLDKIGVKNVQTSRFGQVIHFDAIGKSNIKDFKGIHGSAFTLNPEVEKRYIPLAEQTIANYRGILGDNRIKKSPAVRKMLEDTIERTEKLIEDARNGNYGISKRDGVMFQKAAPNDNFEDVPGVNKEHGEADDSGISQGFGSAGTSLNQVASAMRKIRWEPGTVNVDIGGGRFDKATEYLREKDVENLVFDPFNRNSEHNRAVAERVRDEKADTVTCNNVLNVIDSEQSRANVILQAAKALRKGGTAYFSVYEGDKSGVGRQTKTDSWQNNRPTRDYVPEIEQYFEDVTLKNGVITARNPIPTDELSVWDFDGQYSGNGIAFERGSSYRSGSGDVIRFESHAEQLSLFGGVEQSNKRVIEQAKREERAKAVAAMSDAELLKEMQRDIAEFEKLGRGDWGIQTACTDEYDRRHIKEYNAECERVRTMLDENNVSIEEAEDMLCNAIYSWRDGYATADRSKLLAQFDTLNDYYAEKTDERDNADLYQEVESEQAISEADARNTETPTQQEVAPTTQQTEPAKPKKAAFDPSAIKLRKLKSGETCHVERRYQESGGFDFTGSEIIKDDADLAYIFRNLENSAIENTFLVLIKNGKATILHTGMGSYAASVGHVGAGLLAASKLKPDHVIFVHNHPSGTLEPSVQDVAMQTRAKKMFGEGVVREAIIIDITSGEYCTFDDGPYTNTEVKKRPTEVENEIPYKTYSFSQYVFDKNYKPGSTMQITDANKAAAFVSSHRLGERDKLSLIVMNRARQVTGNVFLPWTNLDDVDIVKAANKIATYIHQMGGEGGIIYGSGTIDRSKLGPLSREIEKHEVRLDDFINVEGVSAQVQGVLEPEVEYEATPRNTEQPTEVAEDSVGYGDTDDSGISDEELATYDAGRYSFAESVTQGLVDLSSKNAGDQQLRLNAMREFGGNLAKLRKIMNKQKAYDKATVDDIVRLARMVMGNGFFKNMSAYEVKRLLAAIKKGVGAEDLTPIANNVVDMLVSHQLRESKAALAKLMQIKGRKVDARGIEVQAGLDIDGQRMMSALKDGMSLGENGLSTRINDCENRLDSQDETIKKNAISEYQGLMLAKDYHDNILSGEEEEILLREEKRQEEEKIYDFRRDPVLDNDGNAIMNLDGSVRTVERKTLKPEFKTNVTEENKRKRKDVEAAIEKIEQSIRENRMERVTAYSDFMSDVAGDVRASRERAAAWRDEQLRRVEEIHHNANSDLQDIDPKSQTKEKKFVPIFNPKNDLVRGLFMPLATFEKFMRFFGRRFHNGEGYLFDRFVRGMIDCSDKEWRSKRAAHDELDAKVKEVFDGKAKRWSDLFALERKKKYPTIPVEYWDNGERVRESLSQGEALSLYVWGKQKDAEAGLRRMGISEEDMETLKGQLDPKFVELADWVVSDFLPKRREYYNEVYERMFGAPMAAIENYFPIVRNSRDVEKPTDVTERDMSTANASTITGSFIKRVRTAAALDIHTDFFSHLLKHLDDMEHIAAWAEFNRDLNTLRNYKRFKNRVSNMNSFEFGAGKDLWKAFDNCCAIVAGVYEGNAKSKLDKITLNINKGFTGGAIAFRFNTALKQLLSLPAFWSDASADQLLLYQTNPVGNFIAWKWAMQNLPGFSKRWQSRQVGDTRLMDTDMDWKLWRNKYMKYINRGGMLANAFVDAVTVASGAKAVYETKKRRYKSIGYTDEQAERKALQDAAISYNGSQQSSESGFVSEMQVDRTFLNNMLTIFRNSPFSYGRKMTTGLRELKKRLRPGYKSDFIESEAKKMEREGIPEDNAKKAARRLYRFGGLHAMFDVFNYGYLLSFLWTVLGGSAWYLLFGEDEEKKKEIIKDGTRRTLFAPLEGFTGGNTFADKGSLLWKYASDEDGAEKALQDFVNWSWFTTPMEGETDNFLRDVRFDEQKAMWDVLSLAIQANLGFKPETFTDGVAAIVDYCDGDPQTSKEFLLCFMRVMQVPQSQTDNVYIDELGMTAKDAQKLNAMEMADRYAKYKRRKNDPLSYITHSDDEDKIFEKYRKRFLDNMQERMERLNDEQLEWNFANPNDSERRKATGKAYAKGKGVKDTAGKKPASNWKPETRRSQLKYQRLRDWTDLAEDVLLDTAIEQAKNRGDEEKLKALRGAKKELTEIKRGKHTETWDIDGLGDGSAEDDKAIMDELRARRKELLRELGVI